MADQIQKPMQFMSTPVLETRHSTHLVVNAMPGRFILTFYECLPPIIMGATDAERQREWNKIQSIPAHPVARLVVAESDLEGFIQVLCQQQQIVKQQASGGFRAFA